jgi:hypothetical protein
VKDAERLKKEAPGRRCGKICPEIADPASLDFPGTDMCGKVPCVAGRRTGGGGEEEMEFL